MHPRRCKIKAEMQEETAVTSPQNRFVRAYFYEARGISPRNLLVGSKFYNDVPMAELSSASVRESYRKRAIDEKRQKN